MFLFAMKKGLTQFVSNLLLFMCEITYIDTICVHLLKNAYSNKGKSPNIVGGRSNCFRYRML